jgi:hypothetical protein
VQWDELALEALRLPNSQEEVEADPGQDKEELHRPSIREEAEVEYDRPKAGLPHPNSQGAPQEVLDPDAHQS